MSELDMAMAKVDDRSLLIGAVSRGIFKPTSAYRERIDLWLEMQKGEGPWTKLPKSVTDEDLKAEILARGILEPKKE